MRHLRISWRQFAVSVSAMALTTLLAATVEAESPRAGTNASDDAQGLAERVEELERQNAELREQYRRLPPIQSASWERSSYLGAAEGAAGDSSDIESAVERYMQAREEQEEAEKKEKESQGYEVGSDLGMTAKWNHGLELSTKNKDFRVHVGGRTQFDSSWFDVENNVQNNINIPYQDGVDFRRARLRVVGTMYEVIDWAAEYDFVNAVRVRNSTDNGVADHPITGFTDLWWTIKQLPILGNVRVGNQKEAIGFEHLVSSRFLPFMERSYNQDTFYGGAFNGFTPGIQAFNTYDEEYGTWALGVFKPVDNVFATNAHDEDYAVTGRMTRLLWYCDDGRGLLHVGSSFRQFSTVNDRIRYRARDAVRSGIASVWPIPGDTGTLLGTDGQFLNTELVAVNGPWTFQSEYLVSYMDDAQLATAPPGPNVGTVNYHGGYAQLMYFITGEHDHYNRKTGVFERVTPRENFFLVDTPDGSMLGRGAWQVGARYNYLDLNDNGLNGGILHNGTVGLNWFLNPNMKVQFNYMLTHRDAPLAAGLGDGWINGWGIRVANDF